MKRMRTLCLTGLLWMMTCILYAQNQLITYTVPGDGVELKDDFTSSGEAIWQWMERSSYLSGESR